MQLKIHPEQATSALHEKVKRFFAEVQSNGRLKEKQFIRLTAPIENVDLLRWLSQQNDDIKIYWRSRDNSFAMAGVGAADLVRAESQRKDLDALFIRLSQRLQTSDSNLRYYGGMRFDPDHLPDSDWEKFGSYQFIVPRFEIFSENAKNYFACNFLFDPAASIPQQLYEIQEEIDRLNWDEIGGESAIPPLLSRMDFPDRAGWQKNIRSALDSFERGQIDKIVLARKSEFRFAEKLNGVDLVRRLQNINQRAFYFCFQPAKDVAFIGGTPERLYCRDRQKISSEAIAGTRPRGKSGAVDRKFNNELLRSDKDIREHRFVFESILNSFRQVCTSVEAQENLSVLKLFRVQHLYAEIRGVLKNGITDGQILSYLHPTPAVGGFPREAAMRHIAALEPFDRGWYAGPIGWVGKDAAEFAVAIRSGLVAGDRVNLYSGAGIVPGSSPDKEWEEIENKIGNFIKV